LKKEKKIQNYLMLKKHLIESKAKAIGLVEEENEAQEKTNNTNKRSLY
jgi:hypothetical protein